MPSRSFLAKAVVLAVFTAGVALMGEVGLRLLNQPFGPPTFWRRNDPAWEVDGLARVPVRFDPASFWRHTKAAPVRRDPDELLVLVLGDGEALGLAETRAAWPDTLAHLVGLNETARPVRVVNASEPGYSSLQGRRRLEWLSGLRPDIACFAFGRNDAHSVRLPDLQYARRLDGLGRFARSWLALHAAHLAWGWLAPEARVPRVSVDEFRSNALAFIERARGAGAVPVLVARGPEPYDTVLEALAARDAVALIEASEPAGIADALLDRLMDQGLVLSRRRRAADVELGWASSAQPELVEGWGPAEAGPGGASGRRLAREASLSLERLAGEWGIAVDVTCAEDFAGRVEVAGGASHDLSDCRGREWRRFEIGEVAGERVSVRFVAEGRGSGGLLVHAVRLVPSDEPARIAIGAPYTPELDLTEADDGRPELGPGFWPRETWSDGRRGRWTAREASLCLGRRGAERGLVIDVSLQNPDNVTACRIEANGIPVYAFRTRNGRHRYGIEIQRVAGRVIHVRLVVERTFVPGAAPGAPRDDRALGLFVHSVRLAASEVP